MQDTVSCTTAPLTATQAGMLADSLAFPQSGFHIEQLVCETQEAWDEPAWTQAWAHVLGALPVLRASFAIAAAGPPQQQFAAAAELPRTVWDWQDLSPPEQQRRWDKWVAADRESAFDVSQAPLLRLNVFRLAAAQVRWVWTFHHALLDGRSLLAALALLFASYEAARSGTPMPPTADTSFASFLTWLPGHLAAAHPAAGEFWRQQFAGYAAPAQADAALGPQTQTQFELDDNTTAALHACCAAENTTPQTLCRAAWALTLGRCRQTDDVVFGVVRAGRHGDLPGIAAMTGMLMNTLPVRVRLDNEMTTVDWVQELRRDQLATRPFDYTPLAQIRTWIGWPSRQPLFDSLMVFERYDLSEEMERRFGQGGVRTFRLLERTSFPLVLSITDGPRLRLTLVYDASRFTESEIARLSASMQAALAALPRHADRRLGELDVLATDEPRGPATVLEGPVEAFPAGRRLHDWVDAATKAHAERPAVVGPDGTLTYAALSRRSRCIAQALRSRGAGRDCLIGVCLPRSAGLVAAVLGVSRSGAAYVPLDASLPTERLRELITLGQPAILITDQANRERLAPLGDCLILEDIDAAPPFDPEAQAADPDGSRLAYAIFTSGSTGVPKLVGVEDRQINNLLQFATRQVLQAEDVRWTPFIDAFSSDACVLQVFGALALGGALVALPDLAAVLDSEYADRWTCIGSTPSLLASLLEMGRLPAAIRFVAMGAEVIPPALIEELRRHPQLRRIVNYYGPTETTVFSTLAWVWRRDDDAANASTEAGRVIGRPIANTRIELCDDHGRPTPVGQIGEIWISGAGVARGYLKAADTAHERFTTDATPFCGGQRKYRTGDLARLRSNGQLEFVGRRDDQVKIRGVRIEPAEIEAALERCPGVAQAAVTATGDERPRLAAFCVPLAGQSLLPTELLQQLRAQLPAAMIPTSCVSVEQLPLGPTGKVDRRALALLELPTSESSATKAPPRTPFEAQLAAIWMALLGLDSIGVDDDFFALGGDSLLAVRLALELERLIGRRGPTDTLFHAPTIALLAARLQEDGAPPQQRSLVPLQPLGDKPPLYFVHGYGGSVFDLLAMRPHLPPDQPAFGLQAIGWDGQEDRHTELDEMAAHYLREIRRFQPDGPYYLAGFSLGGLIAYELAQQLLAQGQDVAMLAPIDSNPFRHTLPLGVKMAINGPYLASRLATRVGQIRRLPLAEWPGYLRRRWDTLGRLSGDYYESVVSNSQMQRYPGKIDLFVTERGEDEDARTQVAWDRLARDGVVRHRLDGDHAGIMAPGRVADLIGKLRRVLHERQKAV